jgi:hypothetical protein
MSESNVSKEELKTVLEKFGERSNDTIAKIKELTSTQGESIANMTKHVEEQIAKVQTITKVNNEKNYIFYNAAAWRL